MKDRMFLQRIEDGVTVEMLPVDVSVYKYPEDDTLGMTLDFSDGSKQELTMRAGGGLEKGQVCLNNDLYPVVDNFVLRYDLAYPTRTFLSTPLHPDKGMNIYELNIVKVSDMTGVDMKSYLGMTDDEYMESISRCYSVKQTDAVKHKKFSIDNTYDYYEKRMNLSRAQFLVNNLVEEKGLSAESDVECDGLEME